MAVTAPVTQTSSIAHLSTDPLRNFKFIVTLTPAPGTPNDGITPVLTDAPGYTSASPTSSYPQPTMPFKVSNDALLILASTSTG